MVNNMLSELMKTIGIQVGNIPLSIPSSIYTFEQKNIATTFKV